MRGLIPWSMAGLALSGCASHPAPTVPSAIATPIAAVALRPAVAVPPILASTPAPNPPERHTGVRPASGAVPGGDPLARVARANATARVQPGAGDYSTAVQIYAFAEGALYQVYAAPGRVTDIALQADEKLAGTGPVAAGDTTRWVIGDTESGTGPERRVHILVKPTRPELRTNLVINTDRRTYHLELRATPSTYMAAVSWRYPADEARAAAILAEAARLAQGEAQPLPSSVLNFGYRIVGRASWRPVRVYDDGRRTFIEFPPSVAQGEMPPLWVGGAGRALELVNYRVQGQGMIVDRLFETAELRLGDRRGHQHVRIKRTAEGRP